MYIDATSLAGAGRRFENEVTRLISEALHPFELQLERIEVQVGPTPNGHACRLHAWARRGQTVVIESSASSRLGAIETAAGCLRRALASRMARGLVAADSIPRESRGSEPNMPASDAGVSTASEIEAAPAPHNGSVRRPRVLLALHELDASNACLSWARVLANALQADLDVCRVLPNMPATTALPSGKVWLDATRRLLAVTRETRRWCADVLPHAQLSERLIPGGADVVEETALRARQREVDWIVMADVHDGCGTLATALARAAGCPVLVARAPTSRSTLLVATDVSDDLYSICSRAAALAEALHAPVLAFHDAAFRTPELSSRVNTLTDVWAQIQAERLQAKRHQRLPELEVLLAHGTDHVETILQQARREDAEILIVGASEGAASGADDELAAAVVDRATRSVLVVPSDIRRGSQRENSLPAEAGEPHSTMRGVPLERRRSPRAGLRTLLSNDHRRWRSS
jgi:nucleotide-binding universal stress UspA family protein